MVGLTGVGGGALLVPLPVTFLEIPPIIAVGTEALFVAATKIGAAWSFFQRGRVDGRLVLRMSLGSIPGVVLGVCLLAVLRNHLGIAVNGLLKILIGSLLIVTPCFALFQTYLQKTGRKSLRDRLPDLDHTKDGAVAVGLIGGFLVGMTSMGSGSIIMVLLVLFYSRSLPTLVGTDMAHSVVLHTSCLARAHYATSIRTASLRTAFFSALVAAGISML